VSFAQAHDVGRAIESKRTPKRLPQWRPRGLRRPSWPLCAGGGCTAPGRTHHRNTGTNGISTGYASVGHFAPTHASWMNLLQVSFSIIERQAIHRDTFSSVKDLNAEIRAFITDWKERSHPFVWTKTVEQILKEGQPSEDLRRRAPVPRTRREARRVLRSVSGAWSGSLLPVGAASAN
jgi:hypothetical protein